MAITAEQYKMTTEEMMGGATGQTDYTARIAALRATTAAAPQPTQAIPMDTAASPLPPTYQPPAPPDDMSAKAMVVESRKAVEDAHQKQLDDINKKLAESQKRESEYLSKQEGVMSEADPLTRPFRADIERTERERLKIEENYFANQALVNELDKLLTESIEMTRRLQTQKVPGLAGLQQSDRMIKAQQNVQGRIAVVEAVMAARNNQIGVAQGFIDRTVGAIQADRQDRINYLNNLFNFYEKTRSEEGAKIFNLTQEQKGIINKQIGLLEADYERAEAVAQQIKDIMLENPQMAAEAGLSLSDTHEQTVKKIADWQYKEEKRTLKNNAEEKGMTQISFEESLLLDRNESFRYIDSRGNEMYFEIPPEWETQMVDNSLYRYNPATGESELMIKGTSPLALKASSGGGLGGGGVGWTATGLSPEQSDILNKVGLAPFHQEIVASIMRGDSYPIPPNVARTEDNLKIIAGLGALGFDNTVAHRDHTAMINTVKNMTSAKAMELRRAILSLEGSTKQAERIYADWQATGLPTGFSDYNKAALNTSARLPGDAGVAARTLISHIEDMKAELAIVYRGGGQATDDALAQAQRSLDANWNEAQFAENIKLIRENLQIRRSSIIGAIGEVLEGTQYDWTPDNTAATSTPEDTFNSSLLNITPTAPTTPAAAQVDGFLSKLLRSLGF